MEVSIPFGLTADELVLEPRVWPTTRRQVFEFFNTATDEETSRILTAAVLLQARNPEAWIFDCLSTAIVWERG